METFYETKIRRELKGELGEIKKVTEKYLVEACNPTEAEARLIGNLPDGQKAVTSAKLTNIAHVLMARGTEETFKYYRVKVTYLDHKDDGKLTKIPQNLIVGADSPREALIRMQSWLANEMLDYTIDTITDSKMEGVVRIEEE